MQKLYNFFSISTHRWEILEKELNKKPTLKAFSKTRWSARYQATKSLNEAWDDVLNALQTVSEDLREKSTTRVEASGLYNYFNSLES